MGIMSEATESLDSSIGSSGGCAGTTGASSRSMCRALVRSVGLSVFSNSSLRVFRPATASPCPTAGMPAVDFGAVGQHSCDPIRPVLIFGLAWRCDTVFGPGNRQSHHEWWSQQPLDGIVSSGSLCHCRPGGRIAWLRRTRPRQIQQAAEKRAQNIQAARHGRSSQQSRNMIRTSGCM